MWRVGYSSGRTVLLTQNRCVKHWVANEALPLRRKQLMGPISRFAVRKPWIAIGAWIIILIAIFGGASKFVLRVQRLVQPA